MSLRAQKPGILDATQLIRSRYYDVWGQSIHRRRAARQKAAFDLKRGRSPSRLILRVVEAGSCGQ